MRDMKYSIVRSPLFSNWNYDTENIQYISHGNINWYLVPSFILVSMQWVYVTFHCDIRFT